MGKALIYKQNALNQFFKEMYGDQCGEFIFTYWGLKGYQQLGPGPVCSNMGRITLTTG